MQRLLTIVALFMAALWLPATQHCGLEAAGVLPSHCEQSEGSDDCAGEDSCAQDGCKLLESGNYSGSVSAVKVVGPSLVTCFCLICLNSIPAAPDDGPKILVPLCERTLDWVPTWQFEHRAALPPGAPFSLVA